MRSALDECGLGSRGASAARALAVGSPDVDNNASVTVRSTGQQVKSIVKADDSGTIVVVSNPKPRPHRS